MKRDFVRLALLASIAAVLMYGDDSWHVVAYSIGVIVVLALASHVTRRIAFNKLDLQWFATRAADSPIGAAVVFASIVWFIGTLVQSGVGLLR